MPKETTKNIGIYVALFFVAVAVLIYFSRPNENIYGLPKYLGRTSALKAYNSCKTGKNCVKTHVITNVKMINSNLTEFETTPYTALYTCTDRLSACHGGRADGDKLSSILSEIGNSRCLGYIFRESGEKVPISLDKGVFMNSEKIFGIGERVDRCDGYVSLVIEQYQ